MPYQTSKSQKSFKKRSVVAAVLLLLVILGGAYWWYYLRTPSTLVVTKSGNFTGNSQPTSSATNPAPQKQPTSNTGHSIGSATDTNGQATTSTNPSQWVTSTSGNITVEQPVANASVRSGDTLSGTAKVSTVSFRLVDNSVGVVAEGNLNVVNGKFSGKLDFTAHSSGGQLDVFSTGPNGVEVNEIQIAVNF